MAKARVQALLGSPLHSLFNYDVRPARIELASIVPKTITLSIKLRARRYSFWLDVKLYHHKGSFTGLSKCCQEFVYSHIHVYQNIRISDSERKTPHISHPMTIHQIYTDFQIMPNLQTHMYRVAAVAQQICENFTEPLDAQNIITACLLHDMGNIIKFQLGRFPEFLSPEGLGFWESVQKKYIQKYGEDEYEASQKIAKELKVSQRVQELIHAVGFHQITAVTSSQDFGQKICEYSDDRVTPFGVVPLEERLYDLENRYSQKYPSVEDQQKRKVFAELARQLEKQVFSHATLQPEDITDHTVNTRLENLRNFEIISA